MAFQGKSKDYGNRPTGGYKPPQQGNAGQQTTTAATDGTKRRPVVSIVYKMKGDEKFTRVLGLFENLNRETGQRTSLSVNVKEDITIPAGAKVYCFFEDPNRPVKGTNS